MGASVCFLEASRGFIGASGCFMNYEGCMRDSGG